jgi:multimeric flavodoxin WrbA
VRRRNTKQRLFKFFLTAAVKVAKPRAIRVWQRRFFKARKIAEEVLRLNNALIVYHSGTGNTEKVAHAIRKGIERTGKSVTIKTISEAQQEDFYDYDLVCFGSPVIHAMPPSAVLEFIRKNDERYREKMEVMLASPKLINKNALVFCTYAGPHCGLSEALPAGKYIRQFLEHLGFEVRDEWYELGEFNGWENGSVAGRSGDIRGRPDEEDLLLIELKAARLAKTL